MLWCVPVILFIIITKYYYEAKPKHRKEWCDVMWYIGGKHGYTGVKIPRALIKVIGWFQFSKLGLTLQGVRIIVRNNKKLLLCKLQSGQYDMGAGGMIKAGEKPLTTAYEELDEELGVTGDINYMFTATPAQGFVCLMYVYVIDVSNEIVFNSTDGTYTNWFWIDKTNWREYSDDMRNDTQKLLSDCFDTIVV